MRVVAGDLRGRRLHSVAGRATRPTADRAREGLFSWLGPRVADAAVLDLFAGTGAIGIEALSRGARHVTFVESSRSASAVLRRNLRDLDLMGQARVISRDARTSLERLGSQGTRFDLLFADPPYSSDWPQRLAGDLRLAELLLPAGVLALERPSEQPAAAASPLLEFRGSKTYGGSSFDWYVPAGKADA